MFEQNFEIKISSLLLLEIVGPHFAPSIPIESEPVVEPFVEPRNLRDKPGDTCIIVSTQMY